MSEMSAAEAAVVARFEAGEPAPESWRGGDGLREALERLAAHKIAYVNAPQSWGRSRVVDAVLALPEVAALRAKAAAADRVRELHRSVAARADGRHWAICGHDGDEWPCSTVRALDGDPKC